MAPYVGCCIEGADDGVPFLALSIANETGREDWISVALAWLAEGVTLRSNILRSLRARSSSCAGSLTVGKNAPGILSLTLRR
jgi:hypothetical protein